MSASVLPSVSSKSANHTSRSASVAIRCGSVRKTTPRDRRVSCACRISSTASHPKVLHIPGCHVGVRHVAREMFDLQNWHSCLLPFDLDGSGRSPTRKRTHREPFTYLSPSVHCPVTQNGLTIPSERIVWTNLTQEMNHGEHPAVRSDSRGWGDAVSRGHHVVARDDRRVGVRQFHCWRPANGHRGKWQ